MIKAFKILIKNWDFLLVLLFSGIYIYVFSNLSILRHQSFASGFDLANMGQTVWNTLHGRPFALTGVESTISRFSIHADLILVLLSPIYSIWPKTITLLIIQSTLLGLGAIPVYFMAKVILDKRNLFTSTQTKLSALVISLIYLLNPGMEWINMYDFHGVSLAIPFLLSAFYFAYRRMWMGYTAFVFLAILTKEEISLFIAVLGLYVAFVLKDKGVGFATFISSIAWFLVMILFVIPYFSPDGHYWALDWFTPVNGESVPFRFSSIISLLNQFTLSPDAIAYYIELLKPFGFLPILGLPYLAFSLPELSINLLSSQAQMRSLMFHYDSGIVPSLVIATIFGLKYINRTLYFLRDKFFLSLKDNYLKLIFYAIIALLLIVSLRTNYHYSPLPTTPSCWCIMYQVSSEDRQFAQLLTTIPQHSTITASSEIRAHLTRRENSYNLPTATSSADYVAILDQNRIVGDYEPKEFENALLKEPVFLKTHELLNHIGHFYLFRRKS